MSLSRPVKFPLLKLPWLCIECVIRSWDIFDIISFALISKRTRQIVKILKIPRNGIKIYLSRIKEIVLDNSLKAWYFENERADSWYKELYQDFSEYSLVLQKNTIPLYTIRTDDSLESFCKENEITALKMAMEFLTEVFKCSVETVYIDPDSFPESGDVGVKSTVNLSINFPYDYAQGQKLSLLLENLEVTGTCTLRMAITEKDFYVDPKLFKCRELVFCTGSAAWVTRGILLQFEVPQLHFHYCPFSVEDILSFITNWFHSDNKKLEYLYIGHQNKHISLEQLRGLNPVPFSERNRIPPSESFPRIDFSEGLEIVRHDGLQATIHVKGRDFLFHIWHDQSAITQN
ncbi:unnamed protein product [Caenorhabditis brenneri]